MVPEEGKKIGYRHLSGIAVVLVVLLGLAAAWRWTPLGKFIKLEELTVWAGFLRENTVGPLIVLIVYVFGSLVMVPITAMIFATVVIYDPLPGFFYALIGCHLSAIITFWIGHLLERDTIRKLASSRLNRLNRLLSDHGLGAVFTARMVPVAPFTLINLVAGASHIRFRDFVAGTFLAMSIGIAAITVFEHRLEVAIRNPGWGSFAVLLAVAALIVAMAFGFRHWQRRSEPDDSRSGTKQEGTGSR
jgi:uncharacterized membrane protein YdjX (TVP38/TMEM64 family)